MSEPLRVLIVEDNAANADTFVKAFALLGCEAVAVGSAGRCLKTLPDDFRPDRILIDVSMPEAWIREIRQRFPVPVVGITGGQGASPALADVTVLQKPAEPAAVLAELERAGGARP